MSDLAIVVVLVAWGALVFVGAYKALCWIIDLMLWPLGIFGGKR